MRWLLVLLLATMYAAAAADVPLPTLITEVAAAQIKKRVVMIIDEFDRMVATNI